LLLFLLVFVPAGCRVQRPEPTGFLRDYNSLRLKPGTAVFCSNPATRQALPVHALYFADPLWRAGIILNKRDQDALTKSLKDRLRRYYLRGMKGQTLVFDDLQDLVRLREKDRLLDLVVVESAITSAKRGFGPVRYLIGFGLGDVKMTVECRAVRFGEPDARAEEAVVRTRSHGNPYGGLNPRSMSAFYALRLACDKAARELGACLAGCLPAPSNPWYLPLP